MVGTRLVWNRLSDELRVEIRRRVAGGETRKNVAKSVGVSNRSVLRIMAEAGGMPPRWDTRSAARLSLVDREEISRGLGAGETLVAIAVG
jgi:hypothetical protein